MSEVIKLYANRISEVCSNIIKVFYSYNLVIEDYIRLITLYAFYCVLFNCATYIVCGKKFFIGSIIVMTIHTILRFSCLHRSLDILKLIMDDVSIPIKEIQKVLPYAHDNTIISSSFSSTHDLLLTMLVLTGTSIEANTQIEKIKLTYIYERRLCHIYFGIMGLMLVAYAIFKYIIKGGS